MDRSAWLEALRADGARFADLSRAAGLDAPVPTCPDWTVRDLVAHLGSVHRWVAGHVTRGSTEPAPFRPSTPGDDVLAWFEEGLATVHGTLAGTDPARPAWHFAPGVPMVADFWNRRMAHETAVHRYDAGLAGGTATSFAPEFAADGTHEVLGLLSRYAHREPLASLDGRVRFRCSDTGDTWVLRVSRGRVGTDPGPGTPPDGGTAGSRWAAVTGPAVEVYLALWGRVPLDSPAFEVTGDADLVADVRYGRPR